MRYLHRIAWPLAAASAMVAAPALAQDYDTTSTTVTTDGFDRSTHFDGVYVGGTFGLSTQNNDRGDTLVFDTNRNGSFDNTVTTALGANAFSTGFCNGGSGGNSREGGCRNDKDNIEYSGRIGFDKRLPSNVVIGALIEGSRSDSTDSTTGFSTTPAGYKFVRGIDYAISARARLGYTPSGGALFYATGGGSYAKIDHDFYTTNALNSFTSVDRKKMQWGWQAGGGAEVMLTNNVSLGLEYLYNRYKDNDYYVAVGQGTAAANNPFLLNGGGTNMRPSDTDYDFHSLRASVSLQF